MNLTKTSIPDVQIIEPVLHGDHRGFFMENWRDEWALEIGSDIHFVQDNHSKSAQGTLRGLHYQIKHPQGKFVRVIQGEIYDAVVDMRRGSKTFGQWEGVILSEDNRRSLWVPPGFAHGFYVISEFAEIIYKCTDYYAPLHERCLFWNDPELGIKWPLHNIEVLISDKDSTGLAFAQSEYYP